MSKIALIAICICSAMTVHAQTKLAENASLTMISASIDQLGSYEARPSFIALQSNSRVFNQAPQLTESCDLLRKKKRQTKIALIGTASLGFVLFSIGGLTTPYSIYGQSRGPNIATQLAIGFGAMAFLCGSAGYAIEIPRLSRKYKRCLQKE